MSGGKELAKDDVDCRPQASGVLSCAGGRAGLAGGHPLASITSCIS